MKMIEELSMDGACNRGVSYVGCIKKLEEMGVLNIKKILGVSIGGLIAVCHIIGFTAEEMLDLIVNKNMDNFKDITLSEKGAILKGKKYREWVYEIISMKVDPNITLKQLYEKTGVHFITTTTCIHSNNKKYPEGMNYLSHETTPDFPLVTAINCTMAFPFVFPPVDHEGAKFIDGGVLDSIPVGFMKEDTIILKVNFKPIIGPSVINNPVSYVGKIFELMKNRMQEMKNVKENIVMVVCEDFDVINFEMSIDDKITLYKRGYDAMEKYIEKLCEEETPEKKEDETSKEVKDASPLSEEK